MPLQQDVSQASDFEPSTLTAAADFDDDIEVDVDFDVEADTEVRDAAAVAAASAAADADAPCTNEIDFAALFGPVASRWEAMLRWYELTAPTVTH